MVAGQNLIDTHIPTIVSNDSNEVTGNIPSQAVTCSSHIFPSFEQVTDTGEVLGEAGHTRNSSNTSQMSKASDYSSIHTHSRHSSSGDSTHIKYVNDLIMRIYMYNFVIVL